MIEVDCSLLEDTIMSVSIFVDLLISLVGRHFVMKKFAALKDGFELSHYILDVPNREVMSPKRKAIRRCG